MQTSIKITSLPRLIQQGKHRISFRLAAIATSTFLLLWIFFWRTNSFPSSLSNANKDTPLVQRYIDPAKRSGGPWYIPDGWLDLEKGVEESSPDGSIKYRTPTSPAEAAQSVLEICMRHNHYLDYSKIPLIIHQTWKNSNTDTWSQMARNGVEDWLRVATGQVHSTGPKMAYILWDDEAIDELVSQYEPEMWEDFQMLPHPVEKADIFRVVVLKWFGGVYADIDAQPLQHPYHWVKATDLRLWTDPRTLKDYFLHKPKTESYQAPSASPERPRPVGNDFSGALPAPYAEFMTQYTPETVDVAAVFGIEADTPVDSDAFWRSGYAFPVQVTNWALAMAPHHPASYHYIERITKHMRANMSEISRVDPLDLTGPPALTAAIKDWTEAEDPQFRWESVSGLHDPKGGRGKLIAGDVLILPITGFSPGRGSFHNMGSQGFDHPNARLAHVAQGSWRHTSLRVEAGKLCRTVFGACRDWSKVP